jgi:hypothetical protein
MLILEVSRAATRMIAWCLILLDDERVQKGLLKKPFEKFPQ